MFDIMFCNMFFYLVDVLVLEFAPQTLCVLLGALSLAVGSALRSCAPCWRFRASLFSYRRRLRVKALAFNLLYSRMACLLNISNIIGASGKGCYSRLRLRSACCSAFYAVGTIIWPMLSSQSVYGLAATRRWSGVIAFDSKALSIQREAVVRFLTPLSCASRLILLRWLSSLLACYTPRLLRIAGRPKKARDIAQGSPLIPNSRSLFLAVDAALILRSKAFLGILALILPFNK